MDVYQGEKKWLSVRSRHIQTDPQCLPVKRSIYIVRKWYASYGKSVFLHMLFTYHYAIACCLKADTVFHQICIEGNIASGKTTCLDYFAQTTNIEVLDVHFFVFIYIIKQFLVLTKIGS